MNQKDITKEIDRLVASIEHTQVMILPFISKDLNILKPKEKK